MNPATGNPSRQSGDIRPHPDQVTALPGRGELIYILDGGILQTPGQVALLLLDVDGLKEVNDQHDDKHAAGNRLLQGFADTIFETAGSGRLFRLHGDEYALVFGAKTEEEVKAEIDLLEKTLDDNGTPASIGGRLHRPGESGEKLLASSDKLMMERKGIRKEARRQQELSALPKHKRVAHKIAATLDRYSGVRSPVR